MKILITLTFAIALSLPAAAQQQLCVTDSNGTKCYGTEGPYITTGTVTQAQIAVGDTSDKLNAKTPRRRARTAEEGVVQSEHTKVGGSDAMRNNPTVIKNFLRNVAVGLNAAFPGKAYGILVKPTGNNCDGYSCDIICHGQGSSQQQWDVLGDAGGASVPGWHMLDGPIVVRPCDVVTVVTPQPDQPQPPQPQPDVEQLKAQLTRLQQDFNALRSIVLGNQETIEADLKNLRADTKDIRAIIAAETGDIRAIIKSLPSSGGMIPCESLPTYQSERRWFGTVTSRPVCK